MTTATIIESLNEDLKAIEKKIVLLRAYVDLGGSDEFLSINNDEYGSGGEEVIRFYHDCASLIEHCLKDVENGNEVNKQFLMEKLAFYDIEMDLAKSAMPNVCRQVFD